MLPNPLHPALVHFPIVLVSLLPVVALGALWAIRRGVQPTRAWLLPVAFAGALAVSAWLAVETGEQQEERVENVVSEGVIDGHAEAAERFLLFSLVLVGVTGLGLLRGQAGSIARPVGLVASIGLLALGYQVGHSGGELVYRHGAAAAYANQAGAEPTGKDRNLSAARDDDDDER